MSKEDHHIDWEKVTESAKNLDTSKSQEKAQKAAEKMKEMGIEEGYGLSKENFAGGQRSNDQVICPLCGKIEKKAGGGGAYIKCPQCLAPMSRNLDKKRTAEEDKVD